MVLSTKLLTAADINHITGKVSRATGVLMCSSQTIAVEENWSSGRRSMPCSGTVQHSLEQGAFFRSDHSLAEMLIEVYHTPIGRLSSFTLHLIVLVFIFLSMYCWAVFGNLVWISSGKEGSAAYLPLGRGPEGSTPGEQWPMISSLQFRPAAHHHQYFIQTICACQALFISERPSRHQERTKWPWKCIMGVQWPMMSYTNPTTGHQLKIAKYLMTSTVK